MCDRILMIEMDGNQRIIVVGGGFAGLLISSMLGENVTVLEEHKQIGYPEHCAGLVSIKTARLLSIPQNLIEETYSEMWIHGRDGVLIWRGNPLAVRINRPGLEEWLLHKCMSSGVNVKLNTRVHNITSDGKISLKNKLLKGELIILAEGSRRCFSRRLGLIDESNDYLGLQVELKAKVNTRNIEVYLTPLSSDLFSWLIPFKDENRVIIGLASKDTRSLFDRLKLFQKILERNGKIADSAVIKYFGGTIICGPMGRLVVDRVIGFGDAVQMTKPVSGGGLYPITMASRILAQKLRRFLNGEVEWNIAVNEYLSEVRPLIRRLCLTYMLSRIIRRRNYQLIRSFMKGAWRLRMSGKVLSEVDYDEHLASITKNFIKPRKIGEIFASYFLGLL